MFHGFTAFVLRLVHGSRFVFTCVMQSGFLFVIRVYFSSSNALSIQFFDIPLHLINKK